VKASFFWQELSDEQATNKEEGANCHEKAQKAMKGLCKNG
jgi:hypothetical protein